MTTITQYLPLLSTIIFYTSIISIIMIAIFVSAFFGGSGGAAGWVRVAGFTAFFHIGKIGLWIGVSLFSVGLVTALTAHNWLHATVILFGILSLLLMWLVSVQSV